MNAWENFSARTIGQLRRFAHDSAGNVALIFSLVTPMLIGLAGLGVDSASFYNQQSRMQSVADAAALAVAKEMHLFSDKPTTLVEAGETRVEALIDDAGLADRPHTAEVRVDPKGSYAEVEISMVVNSFLPAEVWGENPIVVKARAGNYGTERLCILGLEKKVQRHDQGGQRRAGDGARLRDPVQFHRPERPEREESEHADFFLHVLVRRLSGAADRLCSHTGNRLPGP